MLNSLSIIIERPTSNQHWNDKNYNNITVTDNSFLPTHQTKKNGKNEMNVIIYLLLLLQS